VHNALGAVIRSKRCRIEARSTRVACRAVKPAPNSTPGSARNTWRRPGSGPASPHAHPSTASPGPVWPRPAAPLLRNRWFAWLSAGGDGFENSVPRWRATAISVGAFIRRRTM